jgi:hypothetical protein
VLKRLYTRSSSSFYTQVEVKLKAISIVFLNCQKMYSGKIDDTMFKNWWSQINKNATLKDVKRRCIDHLNASGV